MSRPSLSGRWCVVPCAVAALVLGACSAGDDALGEPVARPTRAAVDPCSLLSPTEIERVTGWAVPAGTDESELLDGDEVAVCSFTEPDHLGLIQVQVDEESGRPEFDHQRADLESSGMDGRDASIDGASAAFDSPDHGVVGMLVGDTFVQVVTIGSAVDDRHHLDLAAVVAGHLS